MPDSERCPDCQHYWFEHGVEGCINQSNPTGNYPDTKWERCSCKLEDSIHQHRLVAGRPDVRQTRVGSIGFDSGTLVLADPCYLDNEEMVFWTDDGVGTEYSHKPAEDVTRPDAILVGGFGGDISADVWIERLANGVVTGVWVDFRGYPGDMRSYE